MNKEARKRALELLLDQTRLDDQDVAALFDKATSCAYWEALCPGLSANGSTADIAIAPSLLTHADLAVRIARHGFFRTEPLFPSPQIRDMRSCVERLRHAGWPAVFTFVYDQFWSVLRAPYLIRLLSETLGPGYKQNANIWTFFVAAADGARGWPPHADTPGEEGRLTIWIPLTDATPQNGCMYVIPRDLMPESVSNNYSRIASVSRAELGSLLQASRALPARAGSLLGWDHCVIHWGSISSEADSPRISVSAEFVGADAMPYAEEKPLFDASALPEFRLRLRLIGKAIRAYRRFEPLLVRYLDLADRLQALS